MKIISPVLGGVRGASQVRSVNNVQVQQQPSLRWRLRGTHLAIVLLLSLHSKESTSI